MKVTDKCFAIWSFLNRRSRHAYSQAEIRKGLQRNAELVGGLRGLNAKEVLGGLSLLKHNDLVKRYRTKNGIFWRGQGDWPEMLMKKHGGHFDVGEA